MTFEIRNSEIEELLRRLGRSIKSIMPKGWGFTLLIFDYSKSGDKNGDADSLFYISSANRADMLRAMMEFIVKQYRE